MNLLRTNRRPRLFPPRKKLLFVKRSEIREINFYIDRIGRGILRFFLSAEKGSRFFEGKKNEFSGRVESRCQRQRRESKEGSAGSVVRPLGERLIFKTGDTRIGISRSTAAHT